MIDGDAFISRQIGTTGHEIIDPDGEVVAWAVDDCWAAILVSLLNQSVHGELRPTTCLSACDTN